MIEVFLNDETLGYELPYLFDDASVKLDYFGGEIEQVQAKFDLTELTFTGQAKKRIKEFEALNGAFFQMPIKILIDGAIFLDGYIFDYEINDNENKLKASFVKSDLNLLAEKLGGVTSLLLANKYTFTSFDFIVEKSDNEIKKELAMLVITNIMYIFIVKQAIKEAKDYIASLSDISLGATLRKVFEGVFLAIYLGGLAFTLFKVVKQLKDLILPSVKRTKGVSLNELLVRPLEYLGYNLETNLKDLDKIIHWSSRFTKDQNTQILGGVAFDKKINKTDLFVPNSSDRLYRCLEVLKFVQEKYNVRFYVRDKTVFCYGKYDIFWDKLAKATINEDLPLVKYVKNTSEHNATTEINYTSDFSDTWTLENFKGNHFLVTSQLKDYKKSTALGYKSIDYGVARTSRKDILNIVEVFWESFVKTVNTLAEIVKGGKANAILTPRIGVAKISAETFNVAKILYLENGAIPKNHNEKINAKNDYINYISKDSFVLEPRNKKIIHSGIKIKCNTEKFAKLQENKVVTLKSGEIAEVRSLEWFPRKNYAIIDIAINNDYKTNLEENYYESEK